MDRLFQSLTNVYVNYQVSRSIGLYVADKYGSQIDDIVQGSMGIYGILGKINYVSNFLIGVLVIGPALYVTAKIMAVTYAVKKSMTYTRRLTG